MKHLEAVVTDLITIGFYVLIPKGHYHDDAKRHDQNKI